VSNPAERGAGTHMNRSERRRAMRAAGYRRADGKKGRRPPVRVARLEPARVEQLPEVVSGKQHNVEH